MSQAGAQAVAQQGIVFSKQDAHGRVRFGVNRGSVVFIAIAIAAVFAASHRRRIGSRRGEHRSRRHHPAGEPCHCSHQKPSTAASISTATLRQALRMPDSGRRGLATRHHRAHQVLAVQPAGGQHARHVRAPTTGQHQVGSALVQSLLNHSAPTSS